MKQLTISVIVNSDKLLNILEEYKKDIPVYITSSDEPEYVITHIEDSTSCGWDEIRYVNISEQNNFHTNTIEKLINALKKDTTGTFIYVTKGNTSPMHIITHISYSEKHNCYLIHIRCNVYFDEVIWNEDKLIIV